MLIKNPNDWKYLSVNFFLFPWAYSGENIVNGIPDQRYSITFKSKSVNWEIKIK